MTGTKEILLEIEVLDWMNPQACDQHNHLLQVEMGVKK